MPQNEYGFTHQLGLNPTGLAIDLANNAPAGFPTWQTTLFNQNLVIQHTPFAYASGRGPSVQFRFVNNSFGDAGMTDLFTLKDARDQPFLALPFGKGWWCNYQTFIELACDSVSFNASQLAIVRMPDLRVDVYVGDKSSPQNYRPLESSGCFNKLSRPTETTFDLEFKDHTIFHYEYRGLNLANGRPCFQLVSIEDSIGQKLEVLWDTTDKWKLNGVKDASLRETTLNYTGNRVSSIQAFMGSGISNMPLTYNGDRLEAVTNQFGAQTTYNYLDGTKTLVSSLVMNSGQPDAALLRTASFDYVENTELGVWLVISATDPETHTRAYARQMDGSVILTDERTNTTHHFFNMFGGSERIVSPVTVDGQPTERIHYQVFDFTKRLVTRVINPDLRVVDRAYDEGAQLHFASGVAATVENSPAFNVEAGDFTVVVFFKVGSGQNGGTLIDYGGNNGFKMTVGDTSSSFAVAGTEEPAIGHGPAFNNRRHCMVMRRLSGVVRCFFDGLQIGSDFAAAGTVSELGDLLFHNFDGILSRASFWNVALPNDVVLALSIGAVSPIGNEIGLVAYWPMYDGSDSTKIQDMVALRNGELSGNYQWSGFAGSSRGNLIGEQGWLELFPDSPETNPNAPMPAQADSVINTYEYDESDDIVEIIRAANGDVVKEKQSTHFTYGDDSFPHNPTIVTDGNGHPTTYAYVQPSNNGAGMVASVTDRNGHTTDFQNYNDRWLPERIEDALGHHTDLTYDVFDRTHTVKNVFLNQTVTQAYDELHRPTLTTSPNGTTRLNTYNVYDLIKVKDQNDKETEFFHDKCSRQTKSINPDGETVETAYDPAGNVLDVFGPRSSMSEVVKTSYEWDEINRLIKRTDPLGKFRSVIYLGADLQSNIVQVQTIDETENEILSKFDPLGRLTNVDFPDEDDNLVFGYDKLSRRIVMNDPSGETAWLFADPMSQHFAITLPDPRGVILLDHDNEGFRTLLTDPDENVLSYWRDDANRLTHIRKGENETDPIWVKMAYDNGNRLLERIYGDLDGGGALTRGFRTLFEYDESATPVSTGMNRLTSIKHNRVVSSADETVFHLQYPLSGYDPNGNRKVYQRTQFPFTGGQFGNGSSVLYDYSNGQQLLQEGYLNSSAQPFLHLAYAPDMAGNRELLTVTEVGVVRTMTGTFDKADQLEHLLLEWGSLPEEQGEIEYEYADFRGNRTKMTVTSGGGQDSLEVDYTYNLSNQLKKLKVTQLGMTLKEVDYISNGDGQRMQKTVLWYEVPFVTNYVLDGVHVILEKTEEGDTTMRYIPGVAMIVGSGETEVTRFYLHDVLGNVIALVNIPDEEGTPQVTQVYQYDGFGNPLILSQTWEMWNGALTVTDEVPNPYRWNGASGYYWDEDTGLYLMGLRWYDSTTGRFLTRDPIGFGGGDANLYRYVGNNPLNAVDPWGLQGEFKEGNLWDFAKGWAANFWLLGKWITQEGHENYGYAADDPQLRDMKNSMAVLHMRAEASRSTQLEGHGYWTTLDAAGELLMSGWINPTVAQVGGFEYWWYRNPDGTITYMIYNELTVQSFFYHLIPVKQSRDAFPWVMGKVSQTFIWKERDPQAVSPGPPVQNTISNHPYTPVWNNRQ